ncbi:winged helix-turn-helix domain-containing protein (plasmid) [Natrinema zhouii]|uniref:winged helix-turn-helix domain-containing protein n=1 Tax=Natrinema zhouii TaxID=1710539 RepID=UPI001D000FB3|nr:winged helix-turn-helix domain-containing protein [Natrinema zhouii]UHQ98252.1 winged helix-turn-helix domain-containing protein [Natrinema zhouii]
MNGEFDVLVCHFDPCEKNWIQPDGWRGQDSVTCPHCETEYEPKTLKCQKKGFSTREKAGEWRARNLAKRADEAKLYNGFTLEHGQYGDQLEEVNAKTPSPSDEAANLRIAGTEDLLEAHHATERRGETVDPSLEDTIVGDRNRFETLNEYRIQQRSDAFEAQADAIAGNVVTLEDQLEGEYGFFDGDDDRRLTDPDPVECEPEIDETGEPEQALEIRPTPPEQQRLDTITAEVTPTVSEWLPVVLEDLLPHVASAADAIDAEHGGLTASQLASVLADRGVTDGRASYASVLASYTKKYHDTDLDEREFIGDNYERHQQNREWGKTALTSLGTGRNALGLGHDDLAKTVVPVLQATDSRPELVVRFDGQQWLESTHAGTRRKTLATLRALADAVGITIVTSPRVHRILESSHPEFADCVTQVAMSGRQPEETEHAANDCDKGAIYTDLELMDKRAGKLKILTHLERNPGATVKDLAHDDENGLSKGSIRPYIDSLCDNHGYVAVDTRGTENTMTLTERGEVAASMITYDGRVVHPNQESVFATFNDPDKSEPSSESDSVTETNSQSASTVYGTANGMGDGDDGVPAEAALADTGDPAEAGYVQLLPKVADSSWPLHARVTAADARDGVNLNDYPVERWDDGRVTYVSCMEDHLTVSTQYGGTIPTLVRLATALLGDKLWSTVLTPSALGDELEHCFGDAVNTTREAYDHLVRAAQVGWLSEDERAYDKLKDRYAGVRSVLLGKLGELDDLEEDERGDLIRRAHGLLMSATALYDAIGVDISIEVRVPDPNNLNDSQFCRFLSEISTRQASYGMHSLERNFWEEDSMKRKSAMGREIDPSDPNAHLRASWVISGPGITGHAEQIRGAIAARDDDRLDDRTDYDPVELEVPVTDVSDYSSMRHAVETVLEKKNLCPARESEAMRRTVRLFEAYTGSPFDVVDALTALTRSKRPGDVTISDVEHALAALPGDRLLPSLSAPTPGKILKAILAADGPIGRSDILECVGCSGVTYDKHVDRIAAFDILQRVDGRKWTVAIAPWYVPETDATKPGYEDGSVSINTTTVDGVLFDALEELGYDLGDPELIDAFGQPLDRVALIGAIGPWIDDWLDVLTPLLKPKPDAVQRFDHNVVTLGEKPD